MIGTRVVVSALLPSNAADVSGNPVAIGQQAEGDLRLEPAFLGVMPTSA